MTFIFWTLKSWLGKDRIAVVLHLLPDKDMLAFSSEITWLSMVVSSSVKQNLKTVDSIRVLMFKVVIWMISGFLIQIPLFGQD